KDSSYPESQKKAVIGRPRVNPDTPKKKTAEELITRAGPKSRKGPSSPEKSPPQEKDTGLMPLNKYVAHAGICSRRDAADLVKAGKIWVNGQVVTEPGFKVSRKDD